MTTLRGITVRCDAMRCLWRERHRDEHVISVAHERVTEAWQQDSCVIFIGHPKMLGRAVNKTIRDMTPEAPHIDCVGLARFPVSWRWGAVPGSAPKANELSFHDMERPSDALSRGHELVCECRGCGNRRAVSFVSLIFFPAISQTASIADLKTKLRCKNCNARSEVDVRLYALR